MNNILETNITKFCKLVKEINKINEVMECKQSRFTNSSDFLELNSNEVSEFMQKQEELRDLLNEITRKQLVTIPFEEFKSGFDAGKLNVPPYHLCGIGTAETQEVIKKAVSEKTFTTYPVTLVDGIGECYINDSLTYEITALNKYRGCHNYLFDVFSDKTFGLRYEEFEKGTIHQYDTKIKSVVIIKREPVESHRTFEQLGEYLSDNTVPMSVLFDIALKEVLGDVELDPMISCELHSDKWIFSAFSKKSKLQLDVSKNWNIDFWCNNVPLHVNAYPLYEKLREWKFI